LRELLGSTSGLSCDSPPTLEEKTQRSGYPDLRVVDLASRRVFYLDPKFYAVAAATAVSAHFISNRKTATNKVGDDAVHLIVGFEHERTREKWTMEIHGAGTSSIFPIQGEVEAEFQGAITTYIARGDCGIRERAIDRLYSALGITITNTSKNKSRSCSYGYWT
jgi:hypothetical protein